MSLITYLDLTCIYSAALQKCKFLGLQESVSCTDTHNDIQSHMMAYRHMTDTHDDIQSHMMAYRHMTDTHDDIQSQSHTDMHSDIQIHTVTYRYTQ